jgi:ABC-type transport system involved in cytochrome bd biosynthesis fused ATPase/permease subunit
MNKRFLQITLVVVAVTMLLIIILLFAYDHSPVVFWFLPLIFVSLFLVGSPWYNSNDRRDRSG